MNVRPILYVLAGISASVGTFAQTWTGLAGNGNWSNTGNWNPNSLPGNVVVNFDGANANGQLAINLGATRTIAGIVFFSAAGVNPFTFSNNALNLGTSGIVNNDADAQVFSSSLAITLSGSQQWNAAAGNLEIDSAVTTTGTTLTLTGSNDFIFQGALNGGGTLVKNGSGTAYFQNGGSFSGPATLNAGSIVANISGNWTVPNSLTLNGGTMQLSPTGDFQGLSGTVSISGGATLQLSPGGQISGINSGGSFTFGSTGGTLDLAAPITAGTALGTIAINSASATPAIIKYGTISSGLTPFGWNTSGTDLNVANGNLTGTGALSFQLSNGAMVQYNQSSFGGSLNFTGVSGGDASAGSSGANVGRLMLDTQATFSVTGGITFDNAMQVTVNAAGRTLDADLTINSGTTAFQGRSGKTSDNLTIGASVGGHTLTVKDGATAVMDSRFRTDSTLNSIGGITLNANTVLEAGGSLNFTKSATVSGESIGTITVKGDITGQGTSAKESTISLNTSVTFANPGANGTDLIVNGSGTGGLRVEGTQTRVDNLLTAGRFQSLTGTGGTLTVAYTDNGSRTFTAAPTAATSVRLGFDNVSASAPTYSIGAAVNDMANWGGLVVQGGTVRMLFNESFVGNASTTSLDLLGGTLALNGKNLTFEGGANLTAGTLSGNVGTAGTLIVGGNIVAGPSLSLQNNPNITINVSGPASVSGSSIVGIGTFTKQGNGTTTLNTGITANTIDIQAGTLLLGGNNLIANSTAMKLNANATFGTGGFSDTVGTLTLAGNSTIDLGSGASILNFADSSGIAWTGGTTLTIANWNYGSDQLFFGNAMSALTAGQVSQIKFLNPNGATGIWTATILSTGEIVPVPEPATIAFGASLAGAVGYRERRRIASLLRSFFSVFRTLARA